MKLIGAILIFAVFAWGGFKMSSELKYRCDFLERIITALELLKTEIAFNGSSLKKAFENTAKMSGATLFSEAALYIEREGINSAWKRAVEGVRLNDEDKQMLILLSSKLGKTDAKGQIKHIEYISGIVNESKKKAALAYENAGGLFRRGGILLGIFVVLILI